jgi:hypothetical protein
MGGLILTFVLLSCALGGGWLYWQLRQVQGRLERQDALMAERMEQVNEVVDEIVMAAHYLYEQMDRHLLRMEEAQSRSPAPQPSAPVRARAGLEPAVTPNSRSGNGSRPAPPQKPPASPAPARQQVQPREAPGPAQVAGGGVQKTSRAAAATAASAGAGSDPGVTAAAYGRALELAANGSNLVEVARNMGIGSEELRLLLRFQGDSSPRN